MSTITRNGITSTDNNNDLAITGLGSGVPNLEAGFKVGGAAGVPQASIQDQAINEAKLQVSNAPVNGYNLTAQSGATGGLTWAEAAGGAWSQTSSGTFNNTAILEVPYTKTTQLILENVQLTAASGHGLAIYWSTSSAYQGGNDGTVIGKATSANASLAIATTIANQDRAYLRVTGANTGGATGDFINAQLTFWDPTVSGSTWMSGMLANHHDNGTPYVGFAFATNHGNHVMTKFKLAIDGTTFASGKYKILTLN